MGDSYRLASNEDMQRVLEALDEIPLDGSHVVKISDKKEKRSVRQLRYLWKLIRAIASSGKGSHDTAEGVEVEIKWRFLRPLLISSDTMYAEIMLAVDERYAGDPDMMRFTTAKLFHFSDLNTAEMAECLDGILTYYGRHVDLPIPEEIGLLDY